MLKKWNLNATYFIIYNPTNASLTAESGATLMYVGTARMWSYKLWIITFSSIHKWNGELPRADIDLHYRLHYDIIEIEITARRVWRFQYIHFILFHFILAETLDSRVSCAGCEYVVRWHFQLPNRRGNCKSRPTTVWFFCTISILLARLPTTLTGHCGRDNQ